MNTNKWECILKGASRSESDDSDDVPVSINVFTPRRRKYMESFTHKDVWQKCKDYRRRADAKEFDIDLSDMEMVQLFRGECYNCGYKPRRDIKINGIDRLYNDRGYTRDNCVSCCAVCNYMKGTFSQELFHEKVKQIARKWDMCN